MPISITQKTGADPILRATLVIDENPSPVAAEMTFGPLMMPLDMEVRVRVNQYSDVRVIAETAAGLFMDGRYVRASGGCSAPSTRAPEDAMRGIGEMRLRSFTPQPLQSGTRRETQVMIRHPNYSGLQRDQISQLFIPALFIDRLEVRQGDDLLFAVTGGISISENPVFRFRYTDNGAPTISVRASDTEGNVFTSEMPKTGS